YRGVGLIHPRAGGPASRASMAESMMAAPNPKQDSVENLFILLKHWETPLLTSLRQLRLYSAADCPRRPERPWGRRGRKSPVQGAGRGSEESAKLRRML